MKSLYLMLAIAGALVPYLFFFDFFTAQGFDIPAFVSALFSNGAVGGFTADLLISSAVFWAMMAQAKARRIWLFVLLNLSIGLSCALPAYLYARETGNA